MQITKSNREFAYFICSSMVLLTAILFSFSQLLVVSCIISSVNIIRKVRKSQILLLLSLFFFLYLFPSFLFFYFETQISVYEPFNNAHTFHVVTMIHSVFLYVFSNTVNEKHIRIDDDNLRMNVYKADIPYIICVLGILTTIILGKSGDTIFSGGGYGEGSTRGNALFEYCYVFYLLAYVFSGNSKGKTNLLVVLAVIYIVKSFLYGARIEIIAMTILVFICFFAHSFKTRTILLLAGCAYIGMSMFGVFRGNLNLSSINIGSLIGYDGSLNRLVNNEGDVFYTSASLVGITDYSFFDFSFRFMSFLDYLVRLIIPSSLIHSNYDVIDHLRNYTAFGGGGLFSSFLFFYCSWIGVVAGGFLCGKLWNIVGNISSNCPRKQIFVIMTLVMAPRWFAYSPEAIIKIPLYTILLFEGFKIIFQLQPINDCPK